MTKTTKPDTDQSIEAALDEWAAANGASWYQWARSGSYYAIIVDLGEDEPEDRVVLSYAKLGLTPEI